MSDDEFLEFTDLLISHFLDGKELTQDESLKIYGYGLDYKFFE